MKRDMDLVRSILLSVEEHHQRGKLARQPTSLEGHDKYALEYHRDLLVDEGYLAADVHGSGVHGASAARLIVVTGLTWKGHDLLDLLREEKTWTAAITENPKLRNMPLDVISKVLAEVATRFALGAL